jgi:murein DD-endopeptidase MepM/ murein hydrolase activator NlpD
MPNLGAAPQAPPLAPPPSELPQQVTPPPVTQGEADRSIAEANTDHPIVPIQGVAPNKIKDTFFDNRDGHEHDALDIPATRGTPVIAAVQGNVAKLFHSQEGGTTVYQFDDSGKFCYYYAHLDRYAPGLKEGMLLRQGQVLGYVGATGNAPPTAPHLHFAIFRLGPDKSWWKGTAIDPLPLLK